MEIFVPCPIVSWLISTTLHQCKTSIVVSHQSFYQTIVDQTSVHPRTNVQLLYNGISMSGATWSIEAINLHPPSSASIFVSTRHSSAVTLKMPIVHVISRRARPREPAVCIVIVRFSAPENTCTAITASRYAPGGLVSIRFHQSGKTMRPF